ncbi:putative citrate lyase beta chain [metagenome]|uniref:Putative citrate lyase beta chain n=1 Tax=metagenome TaxID=256318 RepID=A0A2P2C440_9ZZZZ
MTVTPTSDHSLAASATSWLFVPGHRPDLFSKGVSSGADMLVLDLEDGVPSDAKPAARAAVGDWLSGGHTATVRVNAADTAWLADDVLALAGLPGLEAVVLAKAEEVDAVDRLRDELGVPVVLLVETAKGVARVRDLAQARGAARLALGAVDLTLDLGTSQDEENLMLARLELVLASRLGGLAKPLDSVPMGFVDIDAIKASSQTSRRAGFGGRLCIHPAQVAPVNASYLPDEKELAWARAVMANASEAGPTQLEGSMIDRPVVERARRVIASVDPPSAHRDAR